MAGNQYFEAMGRRDWSCGHKPLHFQDRRQWPDWAQSAYLRGYQAQIPWRSAMRAEFSQNGSGDSA